MAIGSILLLLPLASCTEKKRLQPAEVKAVGALRDVLMNGNLAQHIMPDTLSRAGLVALGPANRLQGEISILDDHTYLTVIDSLGQPMPSNSENFTAPFLVWAQVKHWHPIGEIASISGNKQLEKEIERVALKAGLDINIPFPFLLKGIPTDIEYHIISKPESQLTHSHDLHKEAKVSFRIADEEVVLVGFYSRLHEGIFTHANDYIHTHIILQNGITGHVDAISSAKLEILVGLQ
jgi:acetolactate decarboxylase